MLLRPLFIPHYHYFTERELKPRRKMQLGWAIPTISAVKAGLQTARNEAGIHLKLGRHVILNPYTRALGAHSRCYVNSIVHRFHSVQHPSADQAHF